MARVSSRCAPVTIKTPTAEWCPIRQRDDQASWIRLRWLYRCSTWPGSASPPRPCRVTHSLGIARHLPVEPAQQGRPGQRTAHALWTLHHPGEQALSADSHGSRFAAPRSTHADRLYQACSAAMNPASQGSASLSGVTVSLLSSRNIACTSRMPSSAYSSRTSSPPPQKVSP